jgi:hypothetical protein
MRRALALASLLCACGDHRATAVDAPPPDAPPDAYVPMWSAPVTLSDPANQSFSPVIASRAGRVVVAWHDFPAGGASRVVTATINGGTIGPIVPIADTLTGPKRASLAATTSGFVLAWDAQDTGGNLAVRAIELDADGGAIGSPVTISAANAAAEEPRVAAHRDDEAFAWTDGTAHFFARRGPVETVAATPVGTTLLSMGLLSFPRIAVASTGDLLLAYRDGGATASDWDVLLVTRATGGSFGAPANVSQSPGLLSDDISLAIEPDDTLELVWVDQNPIDVNAFEVVHATRSPTGSLTSPAPFGVQDTMTWTPAAIPGNTAVWHTGGGAGGDLFLAESGGAPAQILPGEQGGMPALARDDSGALHLVYTTTTTPRQIRYAVRR